MKIFWLLMPLYGSDHFEYSYKTDEFTLHKTKTAAKKAAKRQHFSLDKWQNLGWELKQVFSEKFYDEELYGFAIMKMEVKE